VRGGLGGEADLFHQRLQVVFQVAVVGQTGLCGVVDADLDVVVGHLQAAGETGQRPQAPDGKRLGGLGLAQAQQGLAQLGCEQRGQRPAFGRFQPHRVDAGGLGVVAHPVQQHGLADAAQSHQHGALGGAPDARAFQRDAQGLAQGITPRELGRWCACAGGEGISNGIHAAILLKFVKL